MSCLQAVLNSTWIVFRLKPLDGLADFGKLDVVSPNNGESREAVK
ncbi:hypothetical protein [Brasilonema octagenarum]|nr:hypothetical protein [Brasilonema octagenarum]